MTRVVSLDGTRYFELSFLTRFVRGLERMITFAYVSSHLRSAHMGSGENVAVWGFSLMCPLVPV